jgi:hypothetical protein
MDIIWDDDYITAAVLLIMQDSDTDDTDTDSSDSDDTESDSTDSDSTNSDDRNNDTDNDSTVSDSYEEEDEDEASVPLPAWSSRSRIGKVPNVIVANATTEPNTKIVNGTKHDFCRNHHQGKGSWVIHHPTRSKNNSLKPEGRENDQRGAKRSLAEAFQAVQDRRTGDSSYDEYE